MKNCITAICLFIFAAALLFAVPAQAQKPVSGNKATQKSATGKASSSGGSGQAGTIGLGIKAGDPTGLSVKFYQQSLDIELVIGRPYYFSGYYNNHRWYHDKFYRIGKDKYRLYHFHSYTHSAPVAFQAHFLKSKATKTAKELKWYYGGGPQFRAFRVEYFYFEPGRKGDYRYLRQDRYTHFDLGLDGVVGLEYTFPDLPLSIFGDVNLFLELADDPFHLSLQGGLGIRYNLK